MRPLIELDHHWWSESRIAIASGILECVVQHFCTDVEKRLHDRPVPAHLVILIHALGHDLVGRTLNGRLRDRFVTPTPRRWPSQANPIRSFRDAPPGLPPRFVDFAIV